MAEGFLRAQEDAGEIGVHDRPPLLDREVFEQYRR
jgi:hypothetical protein